LAEDVPLTDNWSQPEDLLANKSIEEYESLFGRK